jgi:hypothetical protein
MGHIQSVKVWWSKVIHNRGPWRKAMTFLAILVSWELWKEQNARISASSCERRNNSILIAAFTGDNTCSSVVSFGWR